MYVVSNKVVKGHDFFMLVFIYIYVIKDHSCGGMIPYIGE